MPNAAGNNSGNPPPDDEAAKAAQAKAAEAEKEADKASFTPVRVIAKQALYDEHGAYHKQGEHFTYALKDGDELPEVLEEYKAPKAEGAA